MRRLLPYFCVLLTACGAASTSVEEVWEASSAPGKPEFTLPPPPSIEENLTYAYCVAGAMGSNVLRFLAAAPDQQFPESLMLEEEGDTANPLTRTARLSVRGRRFLFSAEPIDLNRTGALARKVYLTDVPGYSQRASAEALFDENTWTDAAGRAFRELEAASFGFTPDGAAFVLRGSGRDSRLMIASVDGTRRTIGLPIDAELLANPQDAGNYVLFDGFEPYSGLTRKYVWNKQTQKGYFMPADGRAQFGGGAYGARLFWFEHGFSFVYGTPSSVRRLTLPVKGAVVSSTVAWRRDGESLEVALVSRGEGALFTAWRFRLAPRGLAFVIEKQRSFPVTMEYWQQLRPGYAPELSFSFAGGLEQLLVIDRDEGPLARVVGLDLLTRELALRGRTSCSEFAREAK